MFINYAVDFLERKNISYTIKDGAVYVSTTIEDLPVEIWFENNSVNEESGIVSLGIFSKTVGGDGSKLEIIRKYNNELRNISFYKHHLKCEVIVDSKAVTKGRLPYYYDLLVDLVKSLNCDRPFDVLFFDFS